jgi:hypothetical protein
MNYLRINLELLIIKLKLVIVKFGIINEWVWNDLIIKVEFISKFEIIKFWNY